MTLDMREAYAVTREFLDTYPGALKLAYRLRSNKEELYGDKADSLPSDMVGGYIPQQVTVDNRLYVGRVDLVVEKHSSGQELLQTLRHEVIGHYGANTFTPAEKRSLLSGLINAREAPGIKPLWVDIDKRYASSSFDMRAEEVFALYSEFITPSHHIGDEGVLLKGQKAFVETCVNQTRVMRPEDLHNIVRMIAEGLHQRARTQQTFPETNQLFKEGDRNMTAKQPFHQVVAEQLIKDLQAGTAPWQRPWDAVSRLPENPTTGNRYKGINALQLLSQGHDDPRWMTYRQAAAAGAQVRKGEKGTPIQYWKFTEEKAKVDDNGNPVTDAQGNAVKETVKLERPRMFMSSVFNAEQIDGLPPLERKEYQWNPVERAEKILKASGAVIQHGKNDRAYYQPTSDSIHLPSPSQFPSSDRYYATALHELGHWTGHSTRLDRDLHHPFGSEGYAKEELRAEIASMMLGIELGIGHDPSQHAAYVGSWISALQDDPMVIFRASSDAEKIQDYILAFDQTQKLEHSQDEALTMNTRNEEKHQTPKKNAPTDTQDKRDRLFLSVPYKEKDEAKALGARWDRQARAWFVPEGTDPAPFAKWSTTEAEHVSEPEREDRVYLAVPYGERAVAKAAGARWDGSAKSWYVKDDAELYKVERWLPNNASNEQSPAMSPRDEFTEALKSVGALITDDHPIMDGLQHRIGVEGDKKGERAGFYVAYMDGHPAGYIKNNRTGIEMKWKSKGYSLSQEEKDKLKAEAAAKLAKRAETLERLHETTAERISEQSSMLMHPDTPTPYMRAKGIKPLPGVLTDKDGKTTYVPACDTSGKQWTMQYIQDDGKKRFAKNSRKEATFHVVGGFDALASAPVLVIAEGYATANSLSDSLNLPTVAAFDSGNLPHVAKALQAKYPDKPIVIAGDNDRRLEQRRGFNPGRDKALEAAKAVNGKAVFPVFAPGEDELTDFNDLANKSALGKAALVRQLKTPIDKVLRQKEDLVVRTEQNRREKKRHAARAV